MGAAKAVSQRHWYRIHVTECPPCGRMIEERERVYGRRPKDPAKRRAWHQVHCGCMY